MDNLIQFHENAVNLKPINLFDFQEVIPEFKEMANCQQNPVHHAEGDVLTHANMALEKVLPLLDQVEAPEDKLILYIATMLHDIGKPATTFFNEKKQKLVSYGHDDAGVLLANEFLKKYFPEFNYKQREKIFRLVEFHMKSREMMREGTTIVKLKQLSLAVNTKMLYLLSQADTMGRKAEDMTSGMMLLEMFKQNCEDMGLWNRPYRIPLAIHLDNASYSLARWNILMNDALENEETFVEAQSIMNKFLPNFQLILMVGAPGSGKSTYTKQLSEKYPNTQIISMDERRKELTGNANDQSRNSEVFNWQEKTLRNTMKNRQNTIIDATNCTRKRRKVLWQIARENGALCSAVYFDLSLNTLLERNTNREKRVPDEVVKRFYNSQQYLMPWEADMVRIVES